MSMLREWLKVFRFKKPAPIYSLEPWRKPTITKTGTSYWCDGVSVVVNGRTAEEAFLVWVYLALFSKPRNPDDFAHARRYAWRAICAYYDRHPDGGLKQTIASEIMGYVDSERI